jgi:assimilatory nitrate reductase catalytic subunit
MRRAARGEAPQPCRWDARSTKSPALHTVIAQHGPTPMGFYVSGQLLTEDYYVFNKLAKGLLGTNNIDTNSRLCMSSAVAGYKATLGADAPPACYDDLEHATAVFITGSNLAWAHPVLFRRWKTRAAPTRTQKLDRRRPAPHRDRRAMADLHLQMQPGTDVVLFHGLLHLMLWEGLDRHRFIAAHTTGFDALRTWCATARPAPPRSAACARPTTGAGRALVRRVCGEPRPRRPRSACTARA